MYHKIVVQECENFPSKCNKHTSLLYNLSSLTYNAQLSGTTIARYTRITCEATNVSIHKTTYTNWADNYQNQIHPAAKRYARPDDTETLKT